MPLVDREGVSLSYTTAGDGPACVLLHPLMMDGMCFEAQVRDLARHHRVIVPDLRGFGASATGTTPSDPSTLAADVIAILDDARVQRAAVCGVSLGGYVAMRMCALWPERVPGIMVVAVGTGKMSALEQERRRRLADAVSRFGTGVLAGAMPQLVPRTAAPELHAKIARYVRLGNPAGIANALRGSTQRVDATAGVRASGSFARVLLGDQDPLVTMEEGRAAADAIGGDLCVMRGVGHFPHLDQPAAFADALGAFLQLLARIEDDLGRSGVRASAPVPQLAAGQRQR